MAIKTLSEVLEAAEAGNYAVGAFNVSDLNQAVAVLEAAEAESSPVILQAITGNNAYADEDRWQQQLRQLMEGYPQVTSVLHLDHGRTVKDCQQAIANGFTSVMIDGSRRVSDDSPAQLGENIELTATVTEYAKSCGVSVEGEVGTIGGDAEDGQIVFTDPDLAEKFVAETGVDALAVAVGTSHGAVKFTSTDMAQRLQVDLIAKIKHRLPNTYLVLHGSSSIPADAVKSINAHGGKLPESFGISIPQKQEGIKQGIRKINQGTDSHLVWTAALREFLTANPSVVEPCDPLRETITAMRELTMKRMRQFGSAGKTEEVS
ncbi:MAG: alpha-1,2-mannosidase [Actinomycetales bacterium]|nr:MAG: alpha-1,2-mannosidase [Actinomycetales bacterium]